MNKEYDVIIVRAVRSFAAMELAEKQEDFNLGEREKLAKGLARQGKTGSCLKCQPCSIICGWGGAGTQQSSLPFHGSRRFP